MKRLLRHLAFDSGASLIGATFIGLAIGVQAQIAVDIGGGPADSFGSIPSAGSWSTKSLVGAAPAPESIADLDLFVNGPTNAASTISAAVSSNTGNPPGTAALATWSSTGFYLQTRPTGNAVTLLMATLTNVSGGTIPGFTVEYAYQQRLTVTGLAQEVVPAHRVYYNLTGAAGSWVALGNFGTTNPVGVDLPISIPIDVSATPWAPNTAMFILFADDNSVPGNDWANSIDNFAINLGGDPSCVGITSQSGNLTLPERGSALFSITATGTPQIIQWRRSDNGGASWTNIPGATASTYTIPSVAYPGDNNARFYATVTNAVCSATSTVKVLTVIPDTVAPTLVRALGGAGLTNVIISFSEALLASGVGPTNFILYPTGGNPDVDYLPISGVVLANGTNVTIITNPNPRTPGVNYSLRIQGIRDNSSQQNLLDPNPTVVQFLTQEALLVDFDVNNVWKYVTLSNQVPSIPAGWETVGFDDSAWPEGPSGLGLDASAGTGTGPGLPQLIIRTPTGYSARSEPTLFRRHFSLPVGTNGLVLNMRHVFEDGAVVFLNGQEAGRFNVAAGMALNDVARAAAAQTDPTPISGPVPLPLTNVHAGDNVIAVMVLQSGGTSSDIEMALELSALIPQYSSAAPALHIQHNLNGSVTVNWAGGGTLQATTNLLSAGTVWTDVPGNPNPYSFTPALGQPVRFFSLR